MNYQSVSLVRPNIFTRTVEAYLGITNAVGDELFSYPFSSSYNQKSVGEAYNEFEENIASIFLGTASVGDEINIYGYLYQGATAGDRGGFAHIHASADTNSVFSFQIDAFESSQPVPEPATVILLGSGLIGFAGLRRRFKK